MKSVILAAGRGSRLKPITNKKHKTLLKVAKKRIIEWQIRNYSKLGIKSINIVVGYKSKQIKENIREFENDINSKINFIKSKEWKETDNLYSLYLAREVVSGNPFILSNGDVFPDKGIFKKILGSTSRAVVPFDSGVRDPEALKLELKNGRPFGILDKGKRNGAGSTIGIFSFDREASSMLFDDIEKNIEFDSEKKQWFESSLARIMKKKTFESIDINGKKWVEVDSVRDIEKGWKMWGVDGFEEYIQKLNFDKKEKYK